MRVQLKCFLREHIACSLVLILEGLRSVYFFHSCGEAVLGCQNEQRIIVKLVGDDNLLDIFTQELFPPVGKWLIHFLEFLKLLFGSLIFIINDTDVILGDGLNLPLFVLR